MYDCRRRSHSSDRLMYDRRVVVHAVVVDCHRIKVLPSLVTDLGVARKITVGRHIASVTAQEIVGVADSVGQDHQLLLLSYSLTAS